MLHFDDKDQVVVRRPDGQFECREVTLGLSNGTLVEAERGLQSGELVTPDPLALLGEREKLEKLGKPTRPAPAPAPSR